MSPFRQHDPSWLAAAVVAVAAAALCAVQFIDPYLWFDESGQFFMGLGINHYSDPYSVRGTLHDVIVNNRRFNLDPGGFTVLVWFWTLVSNSVFFLRLLPLLFFAGSVWFLYRILDHSGIDRTRSFLFLGVYVLFASVFSLVAEFRAYSMEICGTLMTLWLYLKFSDDFTFRRLLVLSLVASFFCTSRYSFILVAFVLALFVLVTLYRREKFGRFLAKSLVFGLPLLATVLAVYFFMTRLQTPGTLGYVGYIGKNPSLLWSPLSLLFYLNILLYGIRFRRDRKSVPFVLTFTLCVSAFFFLLSVCVLFPWDLKRAASVTLLNLVSLMIHFDSFTRNPAWKKWIDYATCAGIALLAVALCYKMGHRGIDDVAREFESLDLSRYESVYVSYDSMPDIKYQYEFGRLRDRVEADRYPDRFVFQVKQEKPDRDSFDNHLLDPQDVDCDLYFNIGDNPGEAFVREENCRYSFKKKQPQP